MIKLILLPILLLFTTPEKTYKVIDHDHVEVTINRSDRMYQKGQMIRTKNDVWRYHGEWKQWNTKGELIMMVVFNKGKIRQVVRYYHPGKEVIVSYDQ